MVKVKPPGVRGPKYIELNETNLADLASIGCTNQELSAILGVSEDTITRNYADILENGRANLRMSLRRKQVEKANAGDGTMLVWLGKNMLGQRDQNPDDISKPFGLNITFTDAQR